MESSNHSSSGDQSRSALEVYREWLNESSASSNSSGTSSGDELSPPQAPSSPPLRRHSSTPTATPSDESVESLPKPFTPSQPPVQEHAQQQIHKLQTPPVRKHAHGSSVPPPSRSSEQAKSPSSGGSKFMNTPRKLMNQMSFRSMLATSPAPAQQVNVSKEGKPRDTDIPRSEPDTREDGASGMRALFGDAWIARPPATRQDEMQRTARAAPIYPIDAAHRTLYDVPLDEAAAAAARESKPPAYFPPPPLLEWEYYRVDGRRGWWVVFCAFLACSISLSTLLTYSVYESYYEFSSLVNDESTAEIDDIYRGHEDSGASLKIFDYRVSTYLVLIGSLMGGFAAAGSVFAGCVADTLGYPICCFLGTVLMSMSLLAASFVSQLWALSILQGALCGLGIALVFTPAYAAPAQWFERHRAVSTGIAISGSAFGTIVLVPVYRAILASRGSALCLRAQALITLVVGAGAAYGLRTRVQLQRPVSMQWQKTMRDTRVLLLMLMAFLIAAARFAQILCLPVFARVYGADQDTTYNILYTMGAASLCGAIIGGSVADKSGYIAGIGLCEALVGLFTLIIWTPIAAAQVSAASIYVYAALFAVSSGVLAAVLPPGVAQMFGSARLATTMGLVIAASAPAIIIMTPVSVKFFDMLGNRHSTAWLVAISGILSILAGCLGFLLPVLQRRHARLVLRRQSSISWTSSN
ncbi:hypothetical protein GGI13_004978 [Coemansia sp. RSA 455]|nr:hypothetical protein GGI13_004978 [Coemansia sp. RSA 455]